MTIFSLRNVSIAGLLAALVTAAPVAAQSRDFVAYASTTPILYRYAACIFEGDAPSAEAQIAQCAELKAELEADADSVIARFHANRHRAVDLELKRGIREIEWEAGLTRSRSRPVPQPIVGYLKCMGEGAMNHPDYKAGTAVSYIGIEGRCTDAMNASAEQLGADRSEIGSIDQLHRRFQLTRRVPYSSLRFARSRTPARAASAPVWLMESGFLNMALVRRVAND